MDKLHKIELNYEAEIKNGYDSRSLKSLESLNDFAIKGYINNKRNKITNFGLSLLENELANLPSDWLEVGGRVNSRNFLEINSLLNVEGPFKGYQTIFNNSFSKLFESSNQDNLDLNNDRKRKLFEAKPESIIIILPTPSMVDRNQHQKIPIFFWNARNILLAMSMGEDYYISMGYSSKQYPKITLKDLAELYIESTSHNEFKDNFSILLKRSLYGRIASKKDYDNSVDLISQRVAKYDEVTRNKRLLK